MLQVSILSRLISLLACPTLTKSEGDSATEQQENCLADHAAAAYSQRPFGLSLRRRHIRRRAAFRAVVVHLPKQLANRPPISCPRSKKLMTLSKNVLNCAV